MNIRQKLYTALVTSSDLQAKVGSNIYFMLFPDNYSFDQAGLYYNLSKSDDIKSLSGQVLEKTYSVTITIASSRTEDLFDISEIIETILDNSFGHSINEYDMEETVYDGEFNAYAVEIRFNINI